VKGKTKKLFSVLLVMALVITQLGGVTQALAQQTNFPDIQGHYAESILLEWIENGFISGVNGYFLPDTKITRSQFVALLNRAFRPEPAESAATVQFSDVKAESWYYKDVILAASLGYINGYSDGRFGPDDPVSRQDAATIISRFLNLHKIIPPGVFDAYIDQQDIAGYAKDSMAALVELGLMKGNGMNSLEPKRAITRAESVILLDRAYKLVHGLSGIMGRIYTNKLPTANAVVTITQKDDHKPVVTLNTDAQGFYAAKLEPGIYEITSALDDKIAYTTQIKVRDQFMTYVKLGLEAGQKVKGTLLDINGKRLPLTNLYFKSHQVFTTQTGPEGEISLVLPVNQEFEIFYEKDGKLVSLGKIKTEPGKDILLLGDLKTSLGTPIASASSSSPSTPSLPPSRDTTPPVITITHEAYDVAQNLIITTADALTLTGTVTDESPITRAAFLITPYGKDPISGTITGAPSWSADLPLSIGTQTVALEFTDSAGNTAKKEILINRLSVTLQFAQNVVVPDDEDMDTLFYDIVATWTDNNGTPEIAEDDRTVVLIRETSSLVTQLKSGALTTGSIYLIPQSSLFLTGFTGKIAGHGEPGSNPEYPLASYPAEEYEEVYFTTPPLQELFIGDVSLDFSQGFDEDDPIAFAYMPNGATLQINNEEAQLQPMRARMLTAAANRYPSPGWQPQELFKALIPKLNLTGRDGSGNRASILLTFDDVVIYDKDGNKDTDNDTITLSGKNGIEDLSFVGGLEWQPNFAPWDFDILPQQILAKISYTKVNELSINYKAELDTEDLVKYFNQGFENNTSIMGIDIEGVEFKDKIVLATFGLRLAMPPVTGSIKSVSDQSKLVPFNPILVFMLVLDLDGSVSGEIGLTFSNNSYNEQGFNIQKKNFTGAYGSLQSNLGQRHYDLPFDRSLEIYDLCAKSKSDRNTKPSMALTLEGEAQAHLELGGGAAAGVMFAGIMPGLISGVVFARAEATLSGEATLDAGGLSVDGSGSVGLSVGLKVAADLRLIAKTFLGNAGIELHKKWEHLFFETGITTNKISGTVYASDTDSNNSNNPVLPGTTVTLTKKYVSNPQTRTTTTGPDGKFVFNSVLSGFYTLSFSKDGYAGYSVEVSVTSGDETVDAFLDTPAHNTLKGKITIADTDTDMTNNQPLAGASVTVKKLTGSQILIKTALSQAQGDYEIDGLPAGLYEVMVSKGGYITTRQVIIIRENQTTYYNATIESIPDQFEGEGIASGIIYDAFTGYGVPGLTLKIRKGMGNTDDGEIVKTLTTGSGGSYTTGYLPAGHYCVEILDERELPNEALRYLSSAFNIKVLGNTTIVAQNGAVTTAMGQEQVRIVLRWGLNPQDLDSHLVGPTSDEGRFHIYYSQQTYEEDGIKMADLDLDDTDSYGPETTTIYYPVPGVYRYYIHDFTNRNSSSSSSMAQSGATVEVYLGSNNVPVYTFYVPNEPGTVWAVFEYDSTTKQITPINTMYFEPDPRVVGMRAMRVDPVLEDIRLITESANEPKEADSIQVLPEAGDSYEIPEAEQADPTKVVLPEENGNNSPEQAGIVPETKPYPPSDEEPESVPYPPSDEDPEDAPYPPSDEEPEIEPLSPLNP